METLIQIKFLRKETRDVLRYKQNFYKIHLGLTDWLTKSFFPWSHYECRQTLKSSRQWIEEIYRKNEENSIQLFECLSRTFRRFYGRQNIDMRSIFIIHACFFISPIKSPLDRMNFTAEELNLSFWFPLSDKHFHK